MSTKPHIHDNTVLMAYLSYASVMRSKYHDNVMYIDQYLERHTGHPRKVVLNAMNRCFKKGLVDYGVSLRAGWITDKGRKALSK